jgi:hypothetical protein
MQLLAHRSTRAENSGDAPFLLILTAGDREQVVLALESVLGEIEDEEFRTRLGVQTAEADALLASLVAQGMTVDPEQSPISRPRISSQDPTGDSIVAFTEPQLLLVNNALNEALHGIAPDYVAPGFRAVDAKALLDSVGTILDGTAESPPKSAGERGYLSHIR